MTKTMSTMLKRGLGLLCLVLMTSGNSASADAAQLKMAGSDFLLYEHGIPIAKVSIDTRNDNPCIAVRMNHMNDRRWKRKFNSCAEGHKSPSLIKHMQPYLPILDQLSVIEEIGWSNLQEARLPNIESNFVARETAGYLSNNNDLNSRVWSQRGAGYPLDLVIDDSARLVAVVDIGRDKVLVRPGLEEYTPLRFWRDAKISPADYSVRALGDFRVKTSDNRELATLVYLPDDENTEEFPAILVRTPYGISDLIERYRHYAARGFAVVLQALGGTSYTDPIQYQSTGAWEAMTQEKADGNDTLKWLTSQSWSNGKVCMEGGSYLGLTQWAAASTHHPALKCIIPEVTLGTAFTDQPYMGGTLVEGFAYYIFYMLNADIIPGKSWGEILAHRPIIDIDKFATGMDLPLWNRIVHHATNDQYWKSQDWYAAGEVPRVATFQISGWFDDDLPATRSTWEFVQDSSSMPQQLMLGPWKHRYNVDRQLNRVDFGPEAMRPDIWLMKLRWHDRFLKGHRSSDHQRNVEYFVLGDNEWRTSTQWPPEDVEYEPWYLHSSGNAAKALFDGSIDSAKPTNNEAPDQYTYDPQSPARNWRSFDLMKSWEDVQRFPYDFKDIEGRPDVAVYTSAVLDTDVTVAGNIEVILFASTDVLDTDWWVHVSDVYPDNQSIRLALGVLRARFRELDDPLHHIDGKNFEQETFLSVKLEDVVRYSISIPAIANTFSKGHRIRVAVTNSLGNYAFPNSNTGDHEGYTTDVAIGTMKIHHSRAYPSHVLLPIPSD